MSSVRVKMEVIKSLDVVSESKQEQQEQEQEEEKEEQHFHVLAVDDSLLDMKLLERLLRGSSYKVTCVKSGDEALKYLGLIDGPNQASSASSSSSTSSEISSQLEGSKVINLIMTDYCMPGMSGYDLLKRVKESSWKDIPVVVMSSENVPSRISMCLEGGAEEFLLKPLQLSDLKRLHPYLLKSLHHNSCDNNNLIKANIEVEDIDQVDQVDQGKSTSENSVKGNNNNNIVSIISKRKAVSTQTISERRPKMKGLAVL